jgi:DNA polymerase-3 subunit delta'
MKAKLESDDDNAIRPRNSYEFVGQDAALKRASSVIRGGLTPSGILISGPPGIGKATLAYRMARYLLVYGATASGPLDLSVGENHPVSRQIAAGAHPGLLVIKRTFDDKGKLRTVVRVDEIRALGGFFGFTSGAEGWRVAIIDCADEMNDNAANALLKLLEEPPSRAILLLVAHAPGRLLPTIRSRCRRLDLRPLDDAAMTKVVDRLLPALDESERDAVISFAEGSPGAALKLGSGEGLSVAREAQILVEEATIPDIPALMALAERISRAPDGLSEFGVHLARLLARRAGQRALAMKRDYAVWADAWEKASSLFSRAVGVRLEPRQTVINAGRLIAAAHRRASSS